MKKIIILCLFFVILLSCEKQEYCLDCQIRIYDIGAATGIPPVYQLDTTVCGFDTDRYSYFERISPRLVYMIQCE